MSRDILLTDIDRDPEQPRKHFDAAALQELADSMAATGLAVPITVKPAGARFVIVTGERRWRAAQLLGWATIRAEVQELDAATAQWRTLVENIQRADLTPIEEAHAFQKLTDAGHTQTEIAKRIGKGQSYVAQKLRLLKMPAEVQAMLGDGRLTEGHARQLLRLPDDLRCGVAQEAIAEGYSVQDTKDSCDYLLMVEYPSNAHVFDDLLALVKRLEDRVNVGGNRAHLFRSERAAGRYLAFGKRVWEEYERPEWVEHFLGFRENAGVGLKELDAMVSLDEDLIAAGAGGLPFCVQMASLGKATFDRLIHEAAITYVPSPDVDVLRHTRKHLAALIARQHPELLAA